MDLVSNGSRNPQRAVRALVEFLPAINLEHPGFIDELIADEIGGQPPHLAQLLGRIMRLKGNNGHYGGAGRELHMRCTCLIFHWLHAIPKIENCRMGCAVPIARSPAENRRAPLGASKPGSVFYPGPIQQCDDHRLCVALPAIRGNPYRKNECEPSREGSITQVSRGPVVNPNIRSVLFRTSRDRHRLRAPSRSSDGRSCLSVGGFGSLSLWAHTHGVVQFSGTRICLDRVAH